MEMNKHWFSMRHFLTDEYRNDIYMGQQQYPICNTNIVTNGLIENLDECTIFASPLKRSVQTVEYIVKTFSETKFYVVYLDQLKERGLGDFEGKPKSPIRNNTEYFVDKKFIVTKTPPNGESFYDFRLRVEETVPIIMDELRERNVLVVSHLQTLRMIRFCVESLYDYDNWYDINYVHGEVVQEYYGKKS